jgi:CheY-like chemotaxis protein
MSVLIVENDADCAEVLECLVRDEVGNSGVWVAPNGMEALKVIESESPDIVFSELTLPCINGLELAMRVRKMPDAASKYLCAVTGFSAGKYYETAIDSGFDHYVLKPYVAEDIGKVLSRVPFAPPWPQRLIWEYRNLKAEMSSAPSNERLRIAREMGVLRAQAQMKCRFSTMEFEKVVADAEFQLHIP